MKAPRARNPARQDIPGARTLSPDQGRKEQKSTHDDCCQTRQIGRASSSMTASLAVPHMKAAAFRHLKRRRETPG
jgi:hypothetical protein